MVSIGWDRVHFSIDGPDAKTHDFLRQSNGSFNKVVENIVYLNRLKEKLNKTKPMLNMNMVLSVYNYNKLPAMVKLAKRLEMKYIFVEPLIVYSEHGEKLKLREEHLKKFRKYLHEAIKLANLYKIDSNFTSIDSNLDSELIMKSSRMNEVVETDSEKSGGKYENSILFSVPCYDPWFHMSIKADGKVTACDVSTDVSENVKEKSLEKIWYGSYFTNLRNNLLGKNIPQYCRQCNPSHTTQRRWLRKMIDELKKQPRR